MYLTGQERTNPRTPLLLSSGDFLWTWGPEIFSKGPNALDSGMSAPSLAESLSLRAKRNQGGALDGVQGMWDMQRQL
jgi:hypothetical protein